MFICVFNSHRNQYFEYHAYSGDDDGDDDVGDDDGDDDGDDGDDDGDDDDDDDGDDDDGDDDDDEGLFLPTGTRDYILGYQTSDLSTKQRQTCL